MEGYISEKMTFKQVSAPADLNTAAVTGARIQVSKGFRVAVICSFGDSTAAVTSITMQQHTLASAGTTKVLATSNPYFHKVAAATSFTKVELSAAASVIAPTVLAADEGIYVFEILAEDLDRENGFDFFSIDVADSTAAKIMGAVYVLHDVRNVPAYELTV